AMIDTFQGPDIDGAPFTNIMITGDNQRFDYADIGTLGGHVRVGLAGDARMSIHGFNSEGHRLRVKRHVNPKIDDIFYSNPKTDHADCKDLDQSMILHTASIARPSDTTVVLITSASTTAEPSVTATFEGSPVNDVQHILRISTQGEIPILKTDQLRDEIRVLRLSEIAEIKIAAEGNRPPVNYIGNIFAKVDKHGKIVHSSTNSQLEATIDVR
ncbi:hypothetical protein KBD81_02955, partial [Candidatus Woesebacteria bacterium]|nr:hypothetical protein [Candidatus Woesebacteria bacterium]